MITYKAGEEKGNTKTRDRAQTSPLLVNRIGNVLGGGGEQILAQSSPSHPKVLRMTSGEPRLGIASAQTFRLGNLL